MAHPNAPRYPAVVAFAESSFFPLPPDVMLARMALGNPHRARCLVSPATIAFILGGGLLKIVGYFAFEVVAPSLHQWGYWEQCEGTEPASIVGDFGAVFLTGFSPTQYKVFAFGTGVVENNVMSFSLASFIGSGGPDDFGRGAYAIYSTPHVDRLGWLLVIVVLGAYLIFRY